MDISTTATKPPAATITTTRTLSFRACNSASSSSSGLMADLGMKGTGASLALVAAVLLLAGCDRDDQQIKVYRVAKAPLENTPPPDAAMPTNASSPSTSMATAPGPNTTAQAPKHWVSQPLSQMRQASFLVRG